MNDWIEQPPQSYFHWRKGITKLHEPGDWEYPALPRQAWTSRDWQYVGWAPHPRGRWQAFWFHYRHGRLMRYPFLSVLAFALKNKGIGNA